MFVPSEMLRWIEWHLRKGDKVQPSRSKAFGIGCRRLAEACVETRLVTRVIAGVRDTETKKKLLAMCPFPALQQTVNICRSEEAARANEKNS